MGQKRNSTYRSNKIAIVAYLRMQGFTPQEIKWENDTCYWYFLSSAVLRQALDLYLKKGALVEPQEYNSNFRVVKQEFWDTDPRPRVVNF